MIIENRKSDHCVESSGVSRTQSTGRKSLMKKSQNCKRTTQEGWVTFLMISSGKERMSSYGSVSPAG